MSVKSAEKRDFTLVELLAVIAVLGLVLIIAVPKITSVMENSKKKTLMLTAKSIARSAEEKKIENDTFDIEEEITCDSISDYSSDDFSSCTIKFNEDLSIIEGKAFSNCKSLKNFNFTKNIKTIGCGSFEKCISLTKLYFNDNLIEIGSGAFRECENLKEI